MVMLIRNFLIACRVYHPMYALFIYPSTLSYQAAAGWITWAWKGHYLFSNCLNSFDLFENSASLVFMYVWKLGGGDITSNKKKQKKKTTFFGSRKDAKMIRVKYIFRVNLYQCKWCICKYKYIRTPFWVFMALSICQKFKISQQYWGRIYPDQWLGGWGSDPRRVINILSFPSAYSRRTE